MKKFSVIEKVAISLVACGVIGVLSAFLLGISGVSNTLIIKVFVSSFFVAAFGLIPILLGDKGKM